MNLTISLGDELLLRLVDPPARVQAVVREEFGPLVGADAAARLCLVFRAVRPVPPATVLATAGTEVAVAADGRPYLVDGAGRAGELPVATGQDEVVVDPLLDPAPRRALVQLLNRVLEWQAHERGMALLKGSSLVLGGRGIALVGFAGSGKSSVLLSLLPEASSYLSEERLVLARSGQMAALPSPVRLAVDRRADAGVVRLIASRRARAGLRMAARALQLPHPAPALVRRTLADRWVSIDPLEVFGHLEWRSTAPLDDIFFLLPGDDGRRDLERLPPAATHAMVSAQVRYITGQFLGPLRAMIEFARPDGSPWPLAAAAEDSGGALDELLHGVQGWAVRVPRRDGVTAAATLIRRCLREA